MGSPAQALWDCLHRGSPFLRAVPVVGARRHSTASSDDDVVIVPDETTAKTAYVHFSNRRQYWYVQVRDWRSPVKKLHSKVGFLTQAEAVAYRDNILAEWGNPVPPVRGKMRV